MNRTSTKLAAVAAGLALATTACGSNDDDPAQAADAPLAVTGAAAAKTAAAELRGGLTYLLTEHVYLAGLATGTAVGKGGDLKDPAVVGAVTALDANSIAIADAVASAYPEAKEPFLTSWRQHIGFFVDYTLGKATKDGAKVAKAKKDLDAYRTSFGQLISSVVPELPADAVAEALVPHVASLFAAIDAQVAGKATQFALLDEAASHMPMTAKTLAGGIDANKNLAGDPADAASELRSGLTFLLTQHVYDAGIAISTAVSNKGSLTAPTSAAAVKALDANSVAIADAVASAYPEAKEPFLASWRQHIGFFVDYTLGKATNDATKVTKAKTDLDGYRTSFGQLISSLVPELPADAVARELVPHVDSLFLAIDSVVAGKASAFKNLGAAASHMPGTAATLASGIAENKKLS
jgi:hypothetical protein